MRPVASFPVPGELRRCCYMAFGSILTLLVVGPVLAQGRARSSIQRMNEQLRQQEIAQLQSQLDDVKKVLDTVTSQGTMTEAQLESARKSAVDAREALKEAAKASKTASSKIRKIEESILETQTSDSDYAKALDGVDAARRAMDAELHRILGRPAPAPDEEESTRLAELARLTPGQRALLNKSETYAEKKTALNDAMKELDRVRSNLFQANDEWKKAREERRLLEQEVSKNEKTNRGAAQDSSEARGDLRSATQIAASARVTIAQIEARLQSLGVNTKQSSDKKPKNGKRGS